MHLYQQIEHPDVKINKKTLSLSETLDHIDLINIYRTFYPKPREHTLYSSVLGTFYKINHMLATKNFNKFKKIEIMSSIFYDQIHMELGINSKKKTGNSPGKNTGVGCHFLLQGIFLTIGLNSHLLCPLHWQVGSLPLSHLGSSQN